MAGLIAKMKRAVATDQHNYLLQSSSFHSLTKAFCKIYFLFFFTNVDQAYCRKMEKVHYL